MRVGKPRCEGIRRVEEVEFHHLDGSALSALPSEEMGHAHRLLWQLWTMPLASMAGMIGGIRIAVGHGPGGVRRWLAEKMMPLSPNSQELLFANPMEKLLRYATPRRMREASLPTKNPRRG